MLERSDSPPIQALAAPSTAPFPAWARTKLVPETQAEAAFLTGAALARLDAIVHENPPEFGAFRQRLALRAAAASLSRAGRGVDENALRDAFHLTRPGADHGPAGRRLLAWRGLTAVSVGQWRSAIGVAATALEIPHDEALQAAIEAAAACASENRLAPFAAARAYQLAKRAMIGAAGRAADGEALAAWLADAVLAQKLNWPFALPLIAEPLFSAAGRRGMPEAGEGGETMRMLLAFARAAERACDLARELQQRAQILVGSAPKLRAKGAGAALQALLDDDSLSAATKISGLSERGARRLFDRLVELGAVRELTGRAAFRLYGL